jgi:hypothetical protein
MTQLHHAYQNYNILPPLNPDEKANPFSKFYYVPVELPAPEILAAIEPGKPMDPAQAIDITEMEKLFTPGYNEVENGYCIMLDGTGYSAVKIDLPNVTVEEFTKFQIYGHMNNVQYKTWFPTMHLQQGAFTIEDFGWGPILFHQRQLLAKNGLDASMVNPDVITPENMNRISMKENGLHIEDPKALDPAFVAFVGGSVYTIQVLTGARDDLTMVTYVRRKGSGLELRVRVWLGKTIDSTGTAHRTIPEGQTVDIDKVLGIVTHNAFEWTRANTIAHDVCQMMNAMAPKA